MSIFTRTTKGNENGATKNMASLSEEGGVAAFTASHCEPCDKLCDKCSLCDSI